MPNMPFDPMNTRREKGFQVLMLICLVLFFSTVLRAQEKESLDPRLKEILSTNRDLQNLSCSFRLHTRSPELPEMFMTNGRVHFHRPRGIVEYAFQIEEDYDTRYSIKKITDLRRVQEVTEVVGGDHARIRMFQEVYKEAQKEVNFPFHSVERAVYRDAQLELLRIHLKPSLLQKRPGSLSIVRTNKEKGTLWIEHLYWYRYGDDKHLVQRLYEWDQNKKRFISFQLRFFESTQRFVGMEANQVNQMDLDFSLNARVLSYVPNTSYVLPKRIKVRAGGQRRYRVAPVEIELSEFRIDSQKSSYPEETAVDAIPMARYPEAFNRWFRELKEGNYSKDSLLNYNLYLHLTNVNRSGLVNDTLRKRIIWKGLEVHEDSRLLNDLFAARWDSQSGRSLLLKRANRLLEEKDRSFPFLFLVAARFSIQQGDLKRAKSFLRRASNEYPYKPVAEYFLSVLRLIEEKSPEAFVKRYNKLEQSLSGEIPDLFLLRLENTENHINNWPQISNRSVKFLKGILEKADSPKLKCAIAGALAGKAEKKLASKVLKSLPERPLFRKEIVRYISSVGSGEYSMVNKYLNEIQDFQFLLLYTINRLKKNRMDQAKQGLSRLNQILEQESRIGYRSSIRQNISTLLTMAAKKSEIQALAMKFCGKLIGKSRSYFYRDEVVKAIKLLYEQDKRKFYEFIWEGPNPYVLKKFLTEKDLIKILKEKSKKEEVTRRDLRLFGILVRYGMFESSPHVSELIKIMKKEKGRLGNRLFYIRILGELHFRNYDYNRALSLIHEYFQKLIKKRKTLSSELQGTLREDSRYLLERETDKDNKTWRSQTFPGIELLYFLSRSVTNVKERDTETQKLLALLDKLDFMPTRYLLRALERIDEKEMYRELAHELAKRELNKFEFRYEASVLKKLVEYYEENNNQERMVDLLKRAVKSELGNINYWRFDDSAVEKLTKFYVESGQTNKVISLLERAFEVELAEKGIFRYYRGALQELVDYYEKYKQKDKAIQAMKKAFLREQNGGTFDYDDAAEHLIELYRKQDMYEQAYAVAKVSMKLIADRSHSDYREAKQTAQRLQKHLDYDRVIQRFLSKHSFRIPEKKKKRAQNLLEELGNKDLSIRRRATHQLKEMGPEVAGYLKKKMNIENPEVRRRIRMIISSFATRGLVEEFMHPDLRPFFLNDRNWAISEN